MRARRRWRLMLVAAALACALVALSCGGDDDDPDPGADDDDDTSGDDGAGGDDAADDDIGDDDAGDDDEEQACDPSEYGPYPVGNRTLLFVDTTRYDPASSSKRTLVTEVWYPAADEARGMPLDTVRNFLLPWDEEILAQLEDFGASPEDLTNFERETGSVRDAPVRGGGPFPLILFSHGNAGVRFQNYSMCEYLASHGFVVAAPDHTGNAMAAPIPDNLVLFDEGLVFISYWQRKDDLSFLVDAFTALDGSDPDGYFEGMIDLDHIGAFGHSFGGTASVEAAKSDARIDATIDICSFMFPWFMGPFEGSLMFVIALEDDTMGDATFVMRWAYGVSPAPKAKLEFFDAGHYTFTDVCGLISSVFGDGDGCGTGERREGGEEFEFIDYRRAGGILNAYATAFYGFNLRGEEHMRAYLAENHAPGDMKHTVEFE